MIVTGEGLYLSFLRAGAGTLPPGGEFGEFLPWPLLPKIAMSWLRTRTSSVRFKRLSTSWPLAFVPIRQLQARVLLHTVALLRCVTAPDKVFCVHPC